jgi:mono/diheme cytochrome c family protein
MKDALAIMLMLAAVGCGSARRDAPSVGAVEPSGERLTVGQQVYMENCYQCHPGGAGGVGPALNNKPLPEFAMKTQVRAGVGAMPAFSKQRINDEQLDGLMAYVKELRAKKSPRQNHGL